MDQQQSGLPPEAAGEFKPGDTISPGVPAQSLPAPVTGAESPSSVPVSQPADPAPPQISQPAVPAASPYVVDPADNASPDQGGNTTDQVSWQASEFVAHSKSTSWYLLLGLAALVLAAAVFLLTRDKISTGVVLIAASTLGFYASRQPRTLQYTLDEHGLTIGEKFFSYNDFRSFAVMDEGAFASISFMPLKRFGQLTTIYYDLKDEPVIVGLLSDRLPIENRQHDAMERLMKRIRF